MEQTLVLVKPDGVKKNLIGEVISRFEGRGLKVAALKLVKLTDEQAKYHYAEHDFITALEFLTRIRFSHSDDWSPQDFSRSVPYFPLVGLIIGSILAVVNYGLLFLYIPDFLRGTLLIFAEIIITGGLMYDGYMDTADGVFSARKRERMLEIMKDSHGYKMPLNALSVVCTDVTLNLQRLELLGARNELKKIYRDVMSNYHGIYECRSEGRNFCCAQFNGTGH